MGKAKRIPYGMTNLETIIHEDYYYVDKTRFISRLEVGCSKTAFCPRSKSVAGKRLEKMPAASLPFERMNQREYSFHDEFARKLDVKA